jgi:hypothetical protein
MAYTPSAAQSPTAIDAGWRGRWWRQPVRKKVAPLDANQLLEQAERQHKNEVCACVSACAAASRCNPHNPCVAHTASSSDGLWLIVPTRLLPAVAALRCVAARVATYGDGGGICSRGAEHVARRDVGDGGGAGAVGAGGRTGGGVGCQGHEEAHLSL